MRSGNWPAGCCPRRRCGHVQTLFDDVHILSLPFTTAATLYYKFPTAEFA